MPNKDLLEDYSDVFSDILNVLLFNGRIVIHPDELENFLPQSQYKAETGILHEEERDVGKFWKHSHINLASIGLENQNKIYKYMPLRTIGYDGANYREQLLKKGIKRAYPVISIVLNFSMKRWTSNLTLHECLDIPEELKPFVNDYKLHVFDIAFLTNEQVEMFQSDFKIVARYFVNRRKKQRFSFPSRIPDHVDEVLKLLSALTGDQRFTSGWVIQPEGNSKQKEDKGMGEKWIDEIENRGVIKGQIMAYYDMGYSVETIAEKLHKTIKYVRQVLNLDPAPKES